MPPIDPMFIEAAGSIATSATSGLFAANQAKKNRAFQERMYYQQLKDNRENWEMVNRFNLPSAQVARLRDANINPLLYYGQGGISNIATNAPTGASAPSGSNAQGARFDNPFSGFTANHVMMEKLQTEIDLLRAEKEKTQSETDWNNLRAQWDRDSYDIRLALKHGDFDYVMAKSRDLNDQVLQRGFMNMMQAGSMALANEMMIRRQNISEFQIGQNILQGWAHVRNEGTFAAAAWRNAVTAAHDLILRQHIAPYQIGVMRETAFKLHQESGFLQKSMDSRVQQEFNKNQLLKKEVSWFDVCRESGLSIQQAQQWESEMRRAQMQQNMDWKGFNEGMDNLIYKPAGLLLNFGGKQTYRDVVNTPDGSTTSTTSHWDWNY